MRTGLAILTIAVVALRWAPAAFGDEIMTINGDRLSGTVLEDDADRVLLRTAYAGIIEIERSQVRSLRRGAAQAYPLAGECPDGSPGTIADGSKPKEQDAEPGRSAAPSSTPAGAGSPRSSSLTPGRTWSGRVNVALSHETGNTDKDEIDIDYHVEYRRGWDRFRSLGTLEFDTNDDAKTTDTWATFNQYSRLSPSGWYGAAWLSLEHDRFADLRLRTVGGPAVGYLVFEREALNLAVEAGPAVLLEDFYGQPDQDFLGGAWFLRYDQLMRQDRLQPYHRQFGYVAVDGADKVLWQAWTGLRVPLAGGFTGAIEFEYDYDSSPAVQANTTDTKLRLKLGYEW